MKIIDCQQGTAEWFQAKIGIPSASCFDQIITPVNGKLSKSAKKYAYRLVAERLLNAPMETMEGQVWMERGKELEPRAALAYSLSEDVETVPVGFITTDDGRFGASPDRLVKGRPWGVEIKAPSLPVYLAYRREERPAEYRPQVQGQMLVADLERVDFFPFFPGAFNAPLTTMRDEPYIALMRGALEQFHDGLLEMLEWAKKLGNFQALAEAVTPLEIERAGELNDTFRQDFGIEDFVR